MARTRKRRNERDAESRELRFARLAGQRARSNRALRREEEAPEGEPFDEEEVTDVEDGYQDAELGGEG
jgi:hypothetical protein